ncbi:hypothetical protein [Parasulfitobacter algicola]|uniref:hypothetical protein n=1 Tax=Parasulfitobacter algicola TaxID=2614809 RepID=UPI001FE772B0|nr:hypothetical protein [Sulfitobacter algicola]
MYIVATAPSATAVAHLPPLPLASLERTNKAKPKPKSQKLTVKRKVGNRNLSVTSVDGNLSIKVAGVPIDQERLEKLGDLVASYLDVEDTEKHTD